MTHELPSPVEATLPQRRLLLRRRQASTALLSPAVLEVIERAAALPRGLALLHRGPLECTAALLSVHPRALERARVEMEDPGARAAAVEAFVRRAARRGRRAGRAPARRPVALRPEDVLAEAERRPGGVELIAGASAECAAIAFGVHPEVVAAARDLLAARRGREAEELGAAPEEAPDERHQG